MEIVKVVGREILDSRGNPDRRSRRPSGRRKPSGAPPFPPAHPRANTKPSNCATAIADRYLGKGTQKAVKNILKKIAPEVTGMEAEEQSAIDRKMIELDGTPNKAKLGANAILAVSMAAARAAAQSQMTPLYRYLGRRQREPAARAA